MFLLELIQTEVHHVRTLKIMQKVSMSFRLLSCDVFVGYGCRQQGLFDTCVLLLLIISVDQFCYFLYYSFLCFGKRKYMFCLQRAGYPRDDLSLTTFNRSWRCKTHREYRLLSFQIFYKGMLNTLNMPPDTVDQILPRLNDLLQINGKILLKHSWDYVKQNRFVDFA